jgi:hypothetical protein
MLSFGNIKSRQTEVVSSISLFDDSHCAATSYKQLSYSAETLPFSNARFKRPERNAHDFGVNFTVVANI